MYTVFTLMSSMIIPSWLTVEGDSGDVEFAFFSSDTQLALQQTRQHSLNVINITFQGRGIDQNVVDGCENKLSSISLSMSLIKRWNTEGAEERPYGVTVYSSKKSVGYGLASRVGTEREGDILVMQAADAELAVSGALGNSSGADVKDLW